MQVKMYVELCRSLFLDHLWNVAFAAWKNPDRYYMGMSIDVFPP